MCNYNDLEESAYADILKRSLMKKESPVEVFRETSFMKKHEEQEDKGYSKTIIKRKIDIDSF